jgi:transposase
VLSGPPGRRAPSIRHTETDPAIAIITQLDPIDPIDPARLTIGVDTHKDIHVASARNALGQKVASTQIPTTPAGYTQLLDWAHRLGPVDAFGVEGTGSYGAALARHLRAHGQQVTEVNRPDRAARRRHGKSDPVDADAAARTVQAGDATGTPKTGDGGAEMIRALRIARSSAVKARTQASNAMKALLITAPAELREQFRSLSTSKLVTATATATATVELPRTPTDAVLLALATLARRHQALTAEITGLDTHLAPLTASTAPDLVAVFGVGPETAGALLIAAGDNPDRLHSEAAFAMLCAAAPIEASSGKTVRYRLNRGGNRQANAALYRIVLVRLRYHQPTRDYMTRRTTEGKTKKEIIRCLKRYVAREVYTALQKINQPEQPASSTT